MGVPRRRRMGDVAATRRPDRAAPAIVPGPESADSAGKDGFLRGGTVTRGSLRMQFPVA